MAATNRADLGPDGVRHRAPMAVLGCSLAIIAAGMAWTLWDAARAPLVVSHTSEVPWPESPWKNARPDVAYVGDAACARCHAEIVETYRHHPMGRSLAPADGETPARPVVFEAAGSRFSVERRDGRTIHREARLDDKGRVLAEVEAPVAYALGSGTRGISYLIEREGRLFQSPISWYGQKKAWDISPGYARMNVHFDRPVAAGCLFCHANQVEPVAGSSNRYAEPIFRGHAIGCERCHGPGELHVKNPGASAGRDPTIVNPEHLTPALRLAVCEQCHVLGVQRVERPGRSMFDYRPGLATTDFLAIYGRAEEAGNRSVDHVSQMKASRCFRDSRGALDCTSCHDPHALPPEKEKIDYYRGRCMECHETRGCRLPRPERLARSPRDDCAGCHMPRSPVVNIAHLATSDHRIPRTPEAPRPSPTPPANGSPLVLINDDGLPPERLAGLDRELAIALAAEAPRMPESPRVRQIGAQVSAELDLVLADHPDDHVARRMKAMVLALSGRRAEAIRQVEDVLKADPRDEKALDECLSYAIDAEDVAAVLTHAREAVALDPTSASFRERLAFASARTGDWESALRESREALRLDPFLRHARMFLIQSLLHRNEPGPADEEYARLVGLYPALRTSLEPWYAERRREAGR